MSPSQRKWRMTLTCLLMFLPDLSGGEEVPDGHVERLARRVRIELYTQLRTDRETFDQYSAAVQARVEAWRTGSRRVSDQDEIIQWLQTLHDRFRPSPQSEPSAALLEYAPRHGQGPLLRGKEGDRLASDEIRDVLPDPNQLDGPTPRLDVAGLGVPRAEAWQPLPQLTVQAENRLRRKQTARRPDNNVSHAMAMWIAPDDSAIDLATLNARIHAFNLTISEIRNELMAPGVAEIDDLERYTAEIERILNSRELSQLYYDSLRPDQRQQVESLDHVGPVVTLLRQRIFEVRTRLADAAIFPGGTLYRSQEKLQTIARRIDLWNIEP